MPAPHRITYFSADPADYPEVHIQTLLEQQGSLLKHDPRRSQVRLLDTPSGKLLVKQPIDKDRRLWIRFLTLFRDSEAMASLRSMQILQAHGIGTNTPLLCVEEIRFGMTVRSWMLYTYLAGEPVTQQDSAAIFELVKRIHAIGYLHGDTQLRNFLKRDGEILTIDCKLKPRLWGRISEQLEFIRIARANPYAQPLLQSHLVSYRIAMYFHHLANRRGHLKNQLRKLLGMTKH